MANQNLTLTFLGGAGTVTGSKYLLTHGGKRRILVDSGMFQGQKELRELNWAPFPTNPATLDAIVLTHAHMDHVGYLPALVKQGFRGPIYATEGTIALAEIVLRDAWLPAGERGRGRRPRQLLKHASRCRSTPWTTSRPPCRCCARSTSTPTCRWAVD